MNPTALPLAHSARPKLGIPAQYYPEHVMRVAATTLENAAAVASYAPLYGSLLLAATEAGAEFHDLGKLDPENQVALRSGTARSLPLNHVDAGVACLLSENESSSHKQLAALLTYSHHIGLPSIILENDREENCFRDCKAEPDGRSLRQLTDERLASYLAIHTGVVRIVPTTSGVAGENSISPMLFRVALSCLVDADHSDTARHYREAPESEPPSLHAQQRLAALDAFVTKLAGGKNDERTRLRQAIYAECRQVDPTPSLWECDSPVGTGKTTAVMAHLLRAAHTKKLRRIFIVLPFTNIIDQAVEVYRKSLVLPGENPSDVVAAHHHKADYEDVGSRHLAALWRAPIVVTTAVQFFETLASRSTSSLRKFHQFVGAGVFIDESHASLPAKLWPQAWAWLREAATDWGCHFVFGSGSLNRIWTIPEIVDAPAQLPRLVAPLVRGGATAAEKQRVTLRVKAGRIALDQLADWLNSFEELPGPRLVIVNTVQIAAALAELLAVRQGRDAVLHLSTALTPHHRFLTLERIKSRLAYRTDSNWTLVATSCVESGVDFSFRSGLRQRASLASILQTTGRVSRNGEFEDAEVWDFELIPGGLVNENPGLRSSAAVLGAMFQEGKTSPEDCTDAMRREILDLRRRELNQPLRKAESTYNYPEVESLFKIIDQATVTAVVSRELQAKLRRHERVDWREIQSHSVQIYANKLAWLQAPEVDGMREVYYWQLPYDDFLGYMAGLLPLLKANTESGCFII